MTLVGLCLPSLTGIKRQNWCRSVLYEFPVLAVLRHSEGRVRTSALAPNPGIRTPWFGQSLSSDHPSKAVTRPSLPLGEPEQFGAFFASSASLEVSPMAFRPTKICHLQ